MSETPRPKGAMRIVSWRNGPKSIDLYVERYQFPGNLGQHDGEWLIISGEIACLEGSWTFRDPCLTSREIDTLAHFLEGPGPGRDPVEQWFTEPNLRFMRPEPDAVHVGFDLESAPPWARSHVVDVDPAFVLRMNVWPDELAATAAALRAAAAAFPPQHA